MEALESKVAFQEDTINALNDALVQQQRRIDELEQLLHMTMSQMGDGEDGGLMEEPPPPHY